MASKSDNETNGCTFEWKIENIFHCLKKPEEKIESPAFIADALQGTKWTLWLYPMEEYKKCKYICIYLNRVKDCSGPKDIQINYQLAFLDKFGSILRIVSSRTDSFGKNVLKFGTFVPRETIFVTGREQFIPENTLTIQCTMWKEGEKLAKTKQISGWTILEVIRRSFVLKINDFSGLKTGERVKFTDYRMDIDLMLSEGPDFEKRLVMDGISLSEIITYLSLKTAVINTEGKEEYCESHEYFSDDLRKRITTTVCFPRILKADKNRYLPNDTLSLGFEFIYSTDTVSYQFCCTGMTPKLKCDLKYEEKKEGCVLQPNTQLIPALNNDLKAMYSNGILSDTELRTSNQAFPAHKNILSARSPVFGKMFSIDMKEKNSGKVDITDLEGDTVRRMLVYIYTDTLEDLQLENARKLYEAADKYEIHSLKNRCLTFLKDNLTPTEVCDVLILADLHQDDKLKEIVLDFILQHDKAVFGSQEWKHFMDTYPKLAADVMFRKVYLG